MRTPVHVACSQPLPEMLTLLIDHGASVLKKSKFAMAPMMHAAIHGQAAIVKALLTHTKAIVNPENDDGLSMQCFYTHLYRALFVSSLKGFLAPLHVASHYGFTEIVSLLIKAGADVNCKDRNRAFTPLHAAADQGYPCPFECSSFYPTLAFTFC